jgi:hypothetical protein
MDFFGWVRNQWDRAVAAVAVALGLLAIVLGWVGVSGNGLPSEQIPYLASGAVLGLFLLGVAATLWLSADMRDEWRKLDEIGEQLREANARLAAAEATPQPSPPARSPRIRRGASGS